MYKNIDDYISISNSIFKKWALLRNLRILDENIQIE